MKRGIVLFAHGSRDPHWRRPFDQIAARIAAHEPDAAVAIAFLEHGPGLEESLAGLQGVGSVHVVPVFLGAGGHVRTDLPRLVEAARRAHPQLEIQLEPVIGEHPGVIDAVARAICAR